MRRRSLTRLMQIVFVEKKSLNAAGRPEKRAETGFRRLNSSNWKGAAKGKRPLSASHEGTLADYCFHVSMVLLR